MENRIISFLWKCAMHDFDSAHLTDVNLHNDIREDTHLQMQNLQEYISQEWESFWHYKMHMKRSLTMFILFAWKFLSLFHNEFIFYSIFAARYSLQYNWLDDFLTNNLLVKLKYF